MEKIKLFLERKLEQFDDFTVTKAYRKFVMNFFYITIPLSAYINTIIVSIFIYDYTLYFLTFLYDVFALMFIAKIGPSLEKYWDEIIRNQN